MSKWIIIPSDSDIVHSFGHKYLEKKKGKSGKWYYIYKRAKNKIKSKLGYGAKQRYEASEKTMRKNIKKMQEADTSNIRNRYDKIKQEYEDYSRRKEDFYNTPIGKLSNLRDKGIEIFNNLFGTSLKGSGYLDISRNELRYLNDRIVPEDITYETVTDYNGRILRDENGKSYINYSPPYKKGNSGISKSTVPKSTSSGASKELQKKLSYEPPYKTTSNKNKKYPGRTLPNGQLNRQSKSNTGKVVGSITDPTKKTGLQRNLWYQVQKQSGLGDLSKQIKGNTGKVVGSINDPTKNKKKRRKS